MFGLARAGVGTRAMVQAANRAQGTIAFAREGTVLEANDNFLSLLGYSLDEVRGQHHRLFVDKAEADGPAYAAFWDRLRAGVSQSGEFRRFGKGGREVWIRATYHPIRDRAGRVTRIVKFAFDVTAEKLASAETGGQIAAINKSQAVIHFLPDGTIVDANANFLAATGYSLEEVRGQHHRMFVGAEHAASHEYAGFWPRLARGEYEAGEYRRFGKGGREIWLSATYNPILDMGGRVFKIVKYANDVTAEKLRAADLAGQIEAIGRSQAVIHFAMDGTILDANDNFLGALGYTLAEVKGRHHRMFVTPAYAEGQAYKDFWDDLRKGRFASAVYQRVGKGGRDVWIQATYNPVMDMSGRPFKVVKYAIDITKSMGVRSAAVQTAERTLGNVQRVAAAAEQMHATSSAIAGQMAQSKATVDEIHARSRAAEASTVQLRTAAGAMDGVVQAITAITDQINLLALNATIEAARAGEAGRGFAVVATEVKNLANQARQATSSVSGEIEAMQSVATEVSGALASISAAVDALHGYVAQTAGVTEQQQASTGEVVGNIQTTAEGVERIARSLDEWVIGMEERRASTRERVFLDGTVEIEAGPGRPARTLTCTVVDMSRTGAKLRAGAADLPDTFRLVIPGQPPRRCQVIRRTPDEVGVTFG